MAKKFEAELKNLMRPRTSGTTGVPWPNFLSTQILYRNVSFSGNLISMSFKVTKGRIDLII